ncbi:CRP-like cAMP-binding protein [Naumannella halotolerans]|uniref:CRP-like cAMP-activated global transcriptional regulator n=1 Tax=Naumannella halotolerans TaxID=993414 RepID=A0A4V3EMF0_9ACTN|nr:CRP-like cAMP-binding protein [Naumannella halotolerans]
MDLDVLRQAPLFAGLDDEAVESLAAAMTTVKLARGEVLFHEGVPGDQLHVIVSGKIKLGRHGSTGRENLLAVLGPGQMFGELSAFDPGPRSTTATAIVDSEIRVLEHDELITWLTGRPEVSRALLGQLASRLRRANDVVSDLVFSDVPGRVAKQLLELADRFGEERDGRLVVRHELTQEELAQLVGASRETVNKALADFATRGWLRLEPRAVVILDKGRLQGRVR